jgi:hypothetical protein
MCNACASWSTKTDFGSLRIISGELSTSSQKVRTQIDRGVSLKSIDSEYEKVKGDLQEAMLYATYRQRKDYFRRKNIGLIGVLFGLTSTTLNVASASNIVASTIFTGLQTATTGYITTDDNLIDPYSNTVITDTKKDLEKLHSDYSNLRAQLQNSSLADNDWAQKYGEAISILQAINFKCFSILPPKEG